MRLIIRQVINLFWLHGLRVGMLYILGEVVAEWKRRPI